jgi:hypothetical protein
MQRPSRDREGQHSSPPFLHARTARARAISLLAQRVLDPEARILEQILIDGALGADRHERVAIALGKRIAANTRLTCGPGSTEIVHVGRPPRGACDSRTRAW